MAARFFRTLGRKMARFWLFFSAGGPKLLTLTINGQEKLADLTFETWGQLLRWLETAQGPHRSVVTAVRFDRVDEPSFRTPPALSRRLQELGAIDLDMCAVGSLIASSVDIALEGLTPLADSARFVGRAFRRHDLAAAQHDVSELVAALQALATLTSAIADASGIAEQWTAERGVGGAVESLRASLESLVRAAEQQDWIAAADVLEHEIAAALPGWSSVLHALVPHHTVASAQAARVA